MKEIKVYPLNTKLKEIQKKWLDYYIETGNKSEAAKRAGYKAKSSNAFSKVGCENYTRLQLFIDERLKSKDAKRIASQDEVLEFLTKIMRGEDTEEVVVVEGAGDGISEARLLNKKLNQKDRIRAAELLAKRHLLAVETAQKQAQINKMKADSKLNRERLELEKAKSMNGNTEYEDDGFMDALQKESWSVWRKDKC